MRSVKRNKQKKHTPLEHCGNQCMNQSAQANSIIDKSRTKFKNLTELQINECDRFNEKYENDI